MGRKRTEGKEVGGNGSSRGGSVIGDNCDLAGLGAGTRNGADLHALRSRGPWKGKGFLHILREARCQSRLMTGNRSLDKEEDYNNNG